MTQAPPPQSPAGRAVRWAPPAARPADARLVLWMTFLSALWGFNAITIKAVTIGMSPLLAIALRGVVALVLLVPWGLWRGERLMFRGPLAVHSAFAGLMFALEFALFYVGAAMTSGGHVAIYINMAPFFVAVGAHYLLPGDRITWLRLVGLLLAFAGIVVLFSDDLLGQQTGYWRGDLLVIAGALVWGLTTVYIKRFMVQAMSGFEMLYVQIAISTPVLLVLAALVQPPVLRPIPPLALGIVLFQGVVIVFFSYLAWNTLLRIYPASALQSFAFLTPLWGVVLGALLLAEPITAGTVAAMALVGAGLYLVNRRAR